jgi:putative tryptophan/tyrosine transport system substrate-binding protein
MVRPRYPAKRLFPILRAIPGCGFMDTMHAGVAAVLLAFLLIPIATAAGKKPYRIGIVLPGDQWVSGVDGLKEALPHIKRVALIGERDADSSIAAFKGAHDIAPELDLILIEFAITSKAEAVQAAKNITLKEADALFLIPSLHTVGAAGEIADVTRAARLPFAVFQVEHVQKHGALLSYGSSYFLQGKQAAALVDKVLRGIPPARLPIERPRRHQLILNLETAREIGVTFSPDVLNRADQLIESGSQR